MITIHKAKVEEVAEIKKLLFETWTSTYSKIYSHEAIRIITSEWHSIKLLTKQIKDSSSCFIVAKEGAKIVGMCNAALTPEGAIINIQRLHVLPQYQRQGIGSKLINEVTKAFLKIHKISLEVEKQNHNAFAFYKRHGYKETGGKVFIIENIKIPCIVMEKVV